MAFKRILDIVDDSNGFMKAGNDLPVGADQEGAEELIKPTNSFFSSLPKGAFDFALFKLDTHFSVEYDLSPESGPFPDIHCEYATDGWQLAVDPDLIDESIPVFYMSKNTFDMWGSNPVPEEQLLGHHGVSKFDDLPFKSEKEKKAYLNLYQVTEDPECLEPGVDRDEFMDLVDENTEVVLIGVASNFCDADAMLGYLERGASVTVLRDLVKGIPLGPEGRKGLLEVEGVDRTAGGTIEEVIATDRFAPYVASGKLTLENSADYLKKLQPPQSAPDLKP
jgi:nicotinamidase-related amidase